MNLRNISESIVTEWLENEGATHVELIDLIEEGLAEILDIGYENGTNASKVNPTEWV